MFCLTLKRKFCPEVLSFAYSLLVWTFALFLRHLKNLRLLLRILIVITHVSPLRILVEVDGLLFHFVG